MQGMSHWLLRSLRVQNLDGPFQTPVIPVADDESTDGTAREARCRSRCGGRRAAPAEWKRKLWALSQGIRQANPVSDYLLFTDADIEYESPEILRALTAKADTGFDLVGMRAHPVRDAGVDRRPTSGP